MFTIAHTRLDPQALQAFERAVPEAEFIYVPLEKLESVSERRFSSLLVTAGAIERKLRASRIAVMKARDPSLIVLVQLPPRGDLLLDWVRRAHADAFVVEGFEDHPQELRHVLASAQWASVVYAFEQACAPTPPLLVASNLERAVRNIARLRKPTALATALGSSLRTLQDELGDASLPPPRGLLAWLRLGTAGRRLGDSDTSTEQVARSVGYESGAALRIACSKFVAASPSEVRNSGGLRFVMERFRVAVDDKRGTRLT